MEKYPEKHMKKTPKTRLFSCENRRKTGGKIA